MITLQTLVEETSEYSELRLASRGVHYNRKYDRTTNTSRGDERVHELRLASRGVHYNRKYDRTTNTGREDELVQGVHFNRNYDRTTNTGRGDEGYSELRLASMGVHYNTKYDRTTTTGREDEQEVHYNANMIALQTSRGDERVHELRLASRIGDERVHELRLVAGVTIITANMIALQTLAEEKSERRAYSELRLAIGCPLIKYDRTTNTGRGDDELLLSGSYIYSINYYADTTIDRYRNRMTSIEESNDLSEVMLTGSYILFNPLLCWHYNRLIEESNELSELWLACRGVPECNVCSGHDARQMNATIQAINTGAGDQTPIVHLQNGAGQGVPECNVCSGHDARQMSATIQAINTGAGDQPR
ncbi:hypothetical protein J6590_036589 [Homalodisca vitripennis]|nr:hypothetical protein J6590_036589 [Homalodisca vitripennis]